MALVTWGEIAALDPFYEVVSLLLAGNGINGTSVFTDNSTLGTTVTVATGSPTISTAQSKFGTASINFPGTSRITVPNDASRQLGTGEFTIEFFARFESVTGAIHLGGNYQGSPTGTWGIFLNGGTSLNFRHADLPTYSYTVSITTGTWYHFAFARIGTTLRVFVDGVQVGTDQPLTSNFNSTTVVSFGRTGPSIPGNYLTGQQDDIRITRGYTRYTTNFTPPVVECSWAGPLPIGYRGISSPLARINFAPPEALAAGGPRGNLIRQVIGARDIYVGGSSSGTITGTVAEKALPTNTPLVRRVLLIDEASRLPIRETWSDATGAYTFSNLPVGVPYTVLSYDHTGTYRAVIADKLQATP
jgi:hypothetical protein